MSLNFFLKWYDSINFSELFFHETTFLKFFSRVSEIIAYRRFRVTCGSTIVEIKLCVCACVWVCVCICVCFEYISADTVQI